MSNDILLLETLCIKDGIGIYGIPASAEEFSESKYRYLRISDISNDGILLNNDKKSVSDNDANKFLLHKNDIVFARTGNSTGRTYFYREKDGDLVYAGFLIKYSLDEKKVNPQYLRYFTISNYYKQWVQNLSNGSTRGNISAKTFSECPIIIPERKQQDDLVNTLSLIDDKIELNNKINSELEAMAREIYEYRFIQFDFPDENGKPYKSSGGKMIWNEELKMEIPEGWKVGNLYNIADFINGLACQKYRPVDNNHRLPVVKITEMHEGITNNTEWVRDDIASKYIIDDGSLLFSWSASLEVMIWNGGKAGLNQHIFNVKPKVASSNFVYFVLSNYVINFIRIAEARKTTMGHITTDHLEQSRIIIPPDNILMDFDNLIKSMMENITCHKVESRELSKLRNFLLPMLMNGQVTVK